MKIKILTLFPDMFTGFIEESIIKRAIEKGVVEVSLVDIREYSLDKHKHVDDTPCGGGAGMVMAVDVVDRCIKANTSSNSHIVMMTPQGQPFDNDMGRELAQYDQVIILCGHYEGFDERIREIIKPKEVSIGDFVLTGGELPALCLIDSVSRKLEGALGKIESMEYDSFEDGLLEYPHYTKPREYRGLEVPEVLLNGNHKLIEEFRREKQIERTKIRRPDLYERWLNES